MTPDKITAELRTVERELLDLREALDDTSDIGEATRIRGVIRARLRRQEELELARSAALRVDAA